MSEVESVKLASDNGHKERWGLKRFLYRQDGKKKTIERKYVLSAVVSTFVIGSFFALIRAPLESQVKTPIDLNETIQVQTVDVPVANVSGTSMRRRRAEAVVHYAGMQVVKRPGFGKIPPGTIGRARLIGGASNGPVSAVLLDSVQVDGESVADAGTKIFGVGNSGVDRLSIAFSRFIFKDGTVQDVKAQACDIEDKTVGIRGSRAAKYGTALAAGIGLNFIAGAAEGLQATEVQNGVAYKKNSLGNAALQGAGRASVETSRELIEEWKEQKKIIEVKAGTEICLLFEGD